MTAENQNFIMTEGDNHDLVYSIVDADGNPQPITGWTFDWTAAPQPGEANVIAKTTPTDVEITDGANGEVVVHLEPADTEGHVSGDCVNFYHELASDNGQKATCATGRMVVRRQNQAP